MELKIKQIFKTDEADILTISVLANTILHEFYGPQMPATHIDFFLDTFQSREAISKQLDENWEYFMITLNDIPIGYLGLDFQGDKIVLSKLYVLATQRNAGAGKAAMRTILGRAEVHNSTVIELRVNQLNERAVNFYEKWGFSTIETLEETYASGHTETDFLMQKTLA